MVQLVNPHTVAPNRSERPLPEGLHLVEPKWLIILRFLFGFLIFMFPLLMIIFGIDMLPSGKSILINIKGLYLI